MRVSVVMPAYNAAATIGKAIQSALDQVVTPDEIVVGCDGCSDDTAAIARSLGATVLELPKGNGAIARNRAAEAAQGDLLFFLDADDWWLPEKIASHLDAWSKARQAGPLPGLVLDPSTIMTPEGKTRGYLGFGPAGSIPWDGFLDRSTWAGGSSFSVPRENYWKVGGFKESLRRLQDVDFLLRCSHECGPALRILPSRTFYRISPLGVSRSAHSMQENIDLALAGWPFVSETQKRRFSALANLCVADVTRFPDNFRHLKQALPLAHQPRFWNSILRSIRLARATRSAG